MGEKPVSGSLTSQSHSPLPTTFSFPCFFPGILEVLNIYMVQSLSSFVISIIIWMFSTYFPILKSIFMISQFIIRNTQSSTN